MDTKVVTNAPFEQAKRIAIHGFPFIEQVKRMAMHGFPFIERVKMVAM
jgi:hypothetical protein